MKVGIGEVARLRPGANEPGGVTGVTAISPELEKRAVVGRGGARAHQRGSHGRGSGSRRRQVMKPSCYEACSSSRVVFVATTLQFLLNASVVSRFEWQALVMSEMSARILLMTRTRRLCVRFV